MTSAEKKYDAIADALAGLPDVARTKMFGMPTISVGGKAFAGFYNGDMVFKLAGDARDAALALPGAHLFDPMGGRPMKEWVVVPAGKSAQWQRLADEAHEVVRARGGKK